MENNAIEASVSTHNLMFRSSATPVTFEVSVSNNSYQFADFHLDVSAPGENRQAGAKWYRLSPDVASAQPHGSTTKFQVIIFDTPIQGFSGAVNLTVRVFSPQLRQERRLLVRLSIESSSRSATLDVDLPIRQFQVYPRNTVDIPVRVRNLSQQFSEVVLRLTGIEPSWLIGGAERRVALDAATQVEIIWQCQPPSAIAALSQNYPFSVEAIDRELPDTDRQGTLEILPVGFIELKIDPQRQYLPTSGKWLPKWKSSTAPVSVLFKNGSNLRQQVEVLLQGKDEHNCRYNSLPPTANLDLGTTATIALEIASNRPWLGMGKTLALEVKGVLSDRRLGSTDPATQSLEVRVLPRIPFWMQLAAIALLAAIIGWLLKPGVSAHTDIVNSVRFSGDADTVVSGSNDGTIRRWQVRGDKLAPHSSLPRGILAAPDRGINILRLMPEDNNRVAAGLENGVVEILNIPTATKIFKLEVGADRVFDLMFTQDSKHLFVGHGSGKVRVWNIPALNSSVPPVPINLLDLARLGQTNFQVYALALSPDRRTLVIGGNFKRFILWDDWEQKFSKEKPPQIAVQKLEKLDSKLSAGTSDYLWALAFAPKSPKILATGDSDGYITMWDLSKCQQEKSPMPNAGIKELNCQERGVIDRWQAGQKAIRSIVFSEDGKLLVSAGDDGKIVAWSLNAESKHDLQRRSIVYDSDRKINTIDLKTTNRGIEIVSGGQDFQVKLHRID